MNPIDRLILEHCRDDFHPLKGLRDRIPSGTLYRHTGRLIRLRWLQKEETLYRSTEVGLRQLLEAEGGRQWEALAKLYSPLALVPTPVHRALVELIYAAVVARQHEVRADRHPFFVAFGRTLRWKTSCGTFVCLSLGLDPALHVVDCAAETGKSLAVRRTATGQVAFKRELLEAPFVVLDEFLSAESSVRATLNVLLGGRVVVPFENEELHVHPVPLLTLNPREKPTLEQRVGLSAPQIRRGILVDLDQVAMPDLAEVGERPLEAARAQGALELSAPAVDCRSFRKPVIDLTRAILAPEAEGRVDIEVVVSLATGMTAFLPDSAEAIAQVGHGLGVLLETLGWTRPRWIEAVTHFSLKTGTKPVRSEPAEITPATTTAIATVTPGRVGKGEETAPTVFSLAVPDRVRRRGHVPDLALSEETRMRIIWFAHETDRDVDGAIDLLLDFFLAQREDGKTLETLATILRLGQQLELAEVEVETLHGHLKTREQLRKEGCDFEDVPEALRLVTVLQALPFAWTWEQADTAMQAVAIILETGIDLANVTKFLEQHRQLEALGFDDATGVAVAEALVRAGATGDRRDAVVRALVEVAGLQADLESLEDDRQRLEASVNDLIATEQRWKTSIQQHRDYVARLKGAVARLNETRGRLQAECDEAAASLAVAEALRAFLMGRTVEAERLWINLEALLAWRRRGGRADDALGQRLSENVHKKIVEFFQKLLEDLSKK